IPSFELSAYRQLTETDAVHISPTMPLQAAPYPQSSTTPSLSPTPTPSPSPSPSPSPTPSLSRYSAS
ncbi:unnamed protein product, partial [Adineta ricciae]